MKKVYIVTAHHYGNWSGPDEDGNCSVEDEDTDVVEVGVYTDRERAIKVAKEYSMNHVVKDEEEAGVGDYGPLDCVSVHGMPVDQEPSAISREHVFSV